jgi:ATP-dependent protease ClpP protease subunit
MKRHKHQMKPVADFDEFEDMFDFSPLVKKKSYPTQQQAVFYIYDEIGPVNQYIDLIHTLDTAQEGTVVHIRIASPGGYLDTLVAILHAIQRTEAFVITHADSAIASAATILFLAGHSMYVYPHASFMFHTVSSGQWGKIQENIANLESVVKRSDKIAIDYLFPVMSMEEIQAMKDGKDFYFEADEMQERLEAMGKWIEEQNKIEEKKEKQKARKKTT